ncbi:hypothetical protein OG401_21450 [Kitasatospora purpeofusca]|uniref:hypothetical protein n=1 Tax=Kitasatospora purpeofusca TaxID=67352 RepID=UPI0022563C52|nr:hypothetical protein [Kitasatospora purpeofusca]MCX4686843.1 hypothetical protein [Kitasatospora purpeofusca]
MPAPSSAFLGPLPAALPPHPSLSPSPRRAGQRLLAVAVLGLAVPLVLGPAAIALPSAPAGAAGAVGAAPVPVVVAEPSEQPEAPAPSGSAVPSDGLSPVASPEPQQEPQPEPQPVPEPQQEPEQSSAGAEPEPTAVAEAPAEPTASEPSTAGPPSPEPIVPEPASLAPAAPVSPSSVVPAATAVAWQAVGRVRPGPSWTDREQRHGRHRPASAPERTGSAPEGAPDLGRAQAAEQAPEPQVAAADAAPGPAAGGADGAVDPAVPDDGSGGETLALGRPGPQAVLVGPALLPTRWDDAATRQLPLGAGLGLIGCGLGLIGLRLRRH